MAGLSDVEIKTRTDNGASDAFDEGICAMLFDIGKRSGFFEGLPVIKGFFEGNQLQKINDLNDAESFGLRDKDVLDGVVKYHIETYYQYIGKEKELYVMFADCSDGFDVIEDIQTLAENKIFQLGIWTEQSLFSKNGDGSYGISSIIGNIQANVVKLAEINGATANNSNMLSVLLFGNTNKLSNSSDVVEYRKLPNLISMNAPKVSVVLGQEGSAATHAMQEKTVGKTPVGLMGFALGCLTLAGAENSIGDVGKYNLNKNEGLKSPELGFGDNYTPLSKMIRIRRHTLSQKGYILLTHYDAKEGEWFFTNDQTLSNGDYGTISNNRLIHKTAKVIRWTMLPYVNGPIGLDSNGLIRNDVMTEITDVVVRALNTYMKNKEGNNQLDGMSVSMNQNANILGDDSISITAVIQPVASNSELEVTESAE